MKLTSTLTAALLLTVAGCGDAQAPYTAQTRADNVGDGVTAIHTHCGEHMMEVFLASEDLGAIRAVETGHMHDIAATLTDYFHWLHSIATSCTDDDGNYVSTGELASLGTDVWITTLLHRNAMIDDAATMQAAHTEERRYQYEMDTILQHMRSAHKALDLRAERYACSGPAPYTPLPVPWVDVEPGGPASE